MVGQTRVHCDKVENLGDFMELVVVLSEGESEAYGTEIANVLKQWSGNPWGMEVTLGGHVHMMSRKFWDLSTPSPTP